MYNKASKYTYPPPSGQIRLSMRGELLQELRSALQAIRDDPCLGVATMMKLQEILSNWQAKAAISVIHAVAN
jgi:hypothetical protein